MFVDTNENQDGLGEDIKVTDEELQGVDLFKDIDPAAATPEQVQQLIKTGKTLLVQKKGWRAKAQKPPEQAPKEIIKPKPAAENEVVEKLQADVQRLNVVEAKRQFGHANSLSPEETDEVFAYATGAGIKPSDALTKPFVKSALESIREQKRADGAIPGPSSRSPLVEGKNFGEMKREDKVKNFGKFVAATQKRK